jgi:hypothetical protein
MVVDVQRGEKETTCTAMGGATLESDAAAALRMMFFAYAEPDLSDDDIYGSKTPRKIGESWPMNADVLRKGWTGMGWKIDAGAMTGQTKLESAETVRDTPMLHVSSTTDLKNATPPGIPPEIRVVSSEFHTRLEASVPVDTMGEMYIKDMSQDAVLHLQDTATGSESDVTMHAAQKESIFPTKP